VTINPLLPYLPAFLSFALYGLLTGFVFLLWKRSRAGCLVTLIFWYAYLVWLFFFLMLLGVETSMNQASFAGGLVLSFARMVWEHRGTQEAFWAFSRVAEWVRDIPRPTWKTKATTEPPKQTASRGHEERARHDREEAMRREQEAREAEARARRAKAEEEARTTEGQGRESTDDQRTHEEVLGLKTPWTQDDLKTAYRRESQRLHPDKWIGKPEPIRQAMEAEYKRVQEAYRTLART
jgi:hypothetical protein